MRKACDVDEEDNKVVELVLKGINNMLTKHKSDSEITKIIDAQTDMLFKLSHHKVFRIQLQVLKLLFAFSRASSGQVQVNTTFEDRFYRTLYEVVLRVSNA